MASARRTKITLPIIAESEMIRQLRPMAPRLPMTCGLVPILRPMTAMSRISAAFVAMSKAFSTVAGRPRQFIAAPKARQMKGISVFIFYLPFLIPLPCHTIWRFRVLTWIFRLHGNQGYCRNGTFLLCMQVPHDAYRVSRLC